MKGTGKRKRKREHLLAKFKEKKKWNLSEKALDRSLWRTGSGRRLRTCRKTDYVMNDLSVYLGKYNWHSRCFCKYGILLLIYHRTAEQKYK
jgi:hypothetical protein